MASSFYEPIKTSYNEHSKTSYNVPIKPTYYDTSPYNLHRLGNIDNTSNDNENMKYHENLYIRKTLDFLISENSMLKNEIQKIKEQIKYPCPAMIDSSLRNNINYDVVRQLLKI